MDRWLTRYEPDIVLLMIGTNDVVQDHQLDTAPERLGDLIDQITATVPTSPCRSSARSLRSWAVRTTSASSPSTPTLPDVVGERIEDGEPVTYVDINAVIDRDDLHTDYIHLNATGYCKLGDVWYRAIRSVRRCSSPPTIRPCRRRRNRPSRRSVRDWPGRTLSRCCARSRPVVSACSPSSPLPSDSGLVGGRPVQPRPRRGASPGDPARKGSASRSSARRWRCRSTTTIRPDRPSTSP